MKKVFITLGLTFFMLINLPASIYRGDIQFEMGYSINNIENKDNPPSLKTDNFNFGIQTWHLFGSSDFFKAGFMVNNELGFGNSRPNDEYTDSKYIYNSYSLIGPAIALDFFGAVRISFATGFATAGNFSNYDNSTIANVNFGIGLDVQAKFLSKFFVSPIIGYRFASTFGNTTSIIIESSRDIDVYVDSGKTQTMKNEFYAGISFNW